MALFGGLFFTFLLAYRAIFIHIALNVIRQTICHPFKIVRLLEMAHQFKSELPANRPMAEMELAVGRCGLPVLR